MGAVAGGVVGAPITMTLLVLETTGNFSLTMGVMASVIACSVVVRQSFGYSFATWRFHLRGERLHDLALQPVDADGVAIRFQIASQQGVAPSTLAPTRSAPNRPLHDTALAPLDGRDAAGSPL